MSVLPMPVQENELIRQMRARNEVLRRMIQEAETELRANEEYIAKRTLDFPGKKLHECVFQILREHGKPVPQEDLEKEALMRGASYGTRNPLGDIRKSIKKLIQAESLRLSRDGKLSLVE